MAPPTIIVHKIPEACGFKSSKPSIAKVKMVGNMIELNNPTARIDHIATKPLVVIDVMISTKAAIANRIKTLLGAITLVKYAPANRPIIDPDQ